VLAVPLRRVRLDLRARKVTRERLNLALIGSQAEIHRSRS
jgi:hypothetical protein